MDDLTEDELIYFKHKLISDINWLNEQLDSFSCDLKQLDQYKAVDVIDIASKAEERNSLMAKMKMTSKKIDKARTVLNHFEDEYGYCESCGVEINKKRLEMCSFTTTCVECQEKIEHLEKMHRKY